MSEVSPQELAFAEKMTKLFSIEEIERGWRRSGYTPRMDTFTLDVLEEWIDNHGNEPGNDDLLHGRLVDWHGDLCRLVKCADGVARIEVTCVCQYCHMAELTVYATSGLHSGAWCYVTDFDGKYLANLRDESYSCEACQEKRGLTDA